MRLYGLLGGKYVSMCEACGKVEACSPGKFILDLLLDAIWWNLGVFAQTFIVSLKLLYLIYMLNRILSISKAPPPPPRKETLNYNLQPSESIGHPCECMFIGVQDPCE